MSLFTDIEQIVSDKDIEKYVLEVYRPLTSPNGAEHWTVLGPYTVIFRPVLGEREVWVEVALSHFCTVTHGVKMVAVNIPGYNSNKPSEQSYYKGDIGGLFGTLRRKIKGKTATPVVRLGNATQART